MILMPTHHLGWTCQLSSFPNARAATIFPPNSHQTCRALGQLPTCSEPDLQVSWDRRCLYRMLQGSRGVLAPTTPDAA